MQNFNEFPIYDIQALRLKKLKKTHKWLAEKLGTNRTYISFALTGKFPELLEKIREFLDEYESIQIKELEVKPSGVRSDENENESRNENNPVAETELGKT